MCLAVPGRITARQDVSGMVDMGGVVREISLMLTPAAKVGDYVLVHAGFAIQIIDAEEAQKTLELFKELEQYAEPESQ